MVDKVMIALPKYRCAQSRDITMQFFKIIIDANPVTIILQRAGGFASA
jgi:hypothetical protein